MTETLGTVHTPDCWTKQSENKVWKQEIAMKTEKIVKTKNK